MDQLRRLNRDNLDVVGLRSPTQPNVIGNLVGLISAIKALRLVRPYW